MDADVDTGQQLANQNAMSSLGIPAIDLVVIAHLAKWPFHITVKPSLWQRQAIGLVVISHNRQGCDSHGA